SRSCPSRLLLLEAGRRSVFVSNGVCEPGPFRGLELREWQVLKASAAGLGLFSGEARGGSPSDSVCDKFLDQPSSSIVSGFLGPPPACCCFLICFLLCILWGQFLAYPPVSFWPTPRVFLAYLGFFLAYVGFFLAYPWLGGEQVQAVGTLFTLLSPFAPVI